MVDCKLLSCLAVVLALLVAVPAKGDDSGRITAAQQALKVMGYDPGPVDGAMGENTRRALEAFQEEFGLAVDGSIDDALLKRLHAEAALDAASPERRLARKGLLRSYTRAVQDGLHDLGFDPGPVDGVVGPLTRKAVRAFQAEAEIDVSGIISPQLLQAINHARGL
ncbi:MAG: peptidoglycan-binding protein [bacterium]|nr:peptidoglycan-binding protein [bacterium]MDE0242439.1 peptidoglycan-binding protein [bacterium]MDE0416684.1 peptidoglycan-binding protein [bacterium]